MNQKKAKALRRKARDISNGALLDRRLLGIPRAVHRGDQSYNSVQAVNDPLSVRGIYRSLKRGGYAKVVLQYFKPNQTQPL